MRWNKDLVVTKSPRDVIDFTFNMKGFLGADAIDTATATDPDGILTIDSVTNSGNKVTIFVSGGQNDQTGRIRVNVVTTNSTPRTIDRTWTVKVEDL